jgi:transcription antitermination factor NusG
MQNASDIEPGFVRPWHAVYTRHQHERTVAELLAQKGLETFLPLYSAVHRWSDRKKRILLPLFPCYVFFAGRENCREQVLRTPGVRSILGIRGTSAEIPREEIDALRRAVEGGLPIEPHPFLRAGQQVRINRGPLEGVCGVLVRKRGSWRLILSVEMLGKSAAVEVEAADVEAMSGCYGRPRPLGDSWSPGGLREAI